MRLCPTVLCRPRPRSTGYLRTGCCCGCGADAWSFWCRARGCAAAPPSPPGKHGETLAPPWPRVPPVPPSPPPWGDTRDHLYLGSKELGGGVSQLLPCAPQITPEGFPPYLSYVGSCLWPPAPTPTFWGQPHRSAAFSAPGFSQCLPPWAPAAGWQSHGRGVSLKMWRGAGGGGGCFLGVLTSCCRRLARRP